MRSSVGPAYLERAKIRAEIGDFDGALADFGQLTVLQANDPGLYLCRGVCFLKKGLNNDAAADFRRVLKLTNHSDFAEPAKNYLRQCESQTIPSTLPTPNPNGSPSEPARAKTHSSDRTVLIESSRRAGPRPATLALRRPDSVTVGPSGPAIGRILAGETSGTFTPAVIEDIQIKAELARYRIRGFGIAPAADLGHVRRPDLHPGHAHPHSPGGLPREVLDADRAGNPVRLASRSSSKSP